MNCFHESQLFSFNMTGGEKEMKYTKLGKTDLTVSRVSYGGIVSAGFYGNVTTPPRGRP